MKKERKEVMRKPLIIKGGKYGTNKKGREFSNF